MPLKQTQFLGYLLWCNGELAQLVAIWEILPQLVSSSWLLSHFDYMYNCVCVCVCVCVRESQKTKALKNTYSL